VSVSEQDTSFNALLPEQFGKYALLGHLATGGMAEVWLARQLGLQGFEKIVVIKRARPELTDGDTTQFFLDEARLVATLEHPNIAQVYEIGFANGAYFFVMEYVDGADLRRLIETALAKRTRIPLGDALYIISHVCTALHYAHEKHDLEGIPQNIIHRDVSPSNVLISHDGAIKVCDFGIAKASNRRSENTQSGVLKGKFSYMSPEQCQSQPLDRRSDVFSIGVLLYELTTLSKLFSGNSDFARLKNIIEAPIPRPSARIPNYPPDLEAIVMKALAKSPADRYQTAQELQLDLEDFARERRLAMSSISIAKLMGSLFERRNDAWIRAQRAHSDHFIEVGATPSATRAPQFFAVGSAPAVSQGETVPMLTPSGGRILGSEAIPATGSGPQRRTALPWLVGAVVSAALAGGAFIAGQTATGSADSAAVAALAADAERISAAFDAAASSAHIRADGIATTPMLRAAIETDAATVNDLANSEIIFTPGKGESLEIFQFRDRTISLLRLPKTAAALPALKGRTIKLAVNGRDAMMIASAPITGYQSKLGGGLVLSTAIDLAAIRRALDEHAVGATLTGLGSDLPLVGTGAPVAPLKLAVPPRGEWNASGVMLVATPKRGPGLPWAGPAGYLFSSLSVLLALGFVISLVRRTRS
jgi:serine/threonine protein kinase